MKTITPEQAEKFSALLKHEQHVEIYHAVQKELDRGSLSSVRAVLKREQSSESNLAKCIIKHAETLCKQ